MHAVPLIFIPHPSLINPFRRLTHRVLVELDAEAYVGALSGVIGCREIIIFKADNVVAEADPGVGYR